MKSFLTVRGNLLIINLVVIGLILWLAISFLHVAVLQRFDAVKLQANVDIERFMFHTNARLAQERDIFDNYLNSLEEPTLQVATQLIDTGLESDAMLNRMVGQINVQTEIKEVFDHMPTTAPQLQIQLADLNRTRFELAEYRELSIKQYLLPIDRRDSTVPSSLFARQTDMIEKVVILAKSLKYLPDTSSSAISHYHDLLNDLLVINVELARKRNVLNRMVFGNRVATISEAFQIAVLDQTIEHRLDSIVNRTQVADNNAELVPIAKEVQRFYKEFYLLSRNGKHFLDPMQAWGMDELSEWRLVMSTISVMTSELAEATHASIEDLGNVYGTRSQRNLIIDAGLVLLCFAITIASVVINRRIKRYAFYDGLTQLFNRHSFELALENTSLSGSKMQAVIFLDLDKFKSINDSYGHAIGDALLIEVAIRLKKTCGKKGVLARMGGDEFAVFIDNVQSESSVESLASEMVAAVKKNIVVRNLELNVGASAGISVSPLDCKCGTELLRNADIAMYHSKAKKLNEVYRFNQQIADIYHQRLQLEADLRKGLDNKEFQVMYQPKVCTQTGQVKSVEALLRWLHPERGFISPAQFIPVAEDIGLMCSIGKWVLNEACRDIAQLQTMTSHRVQVAVNISAQQFSDTGFVNSVYCALNQFELENEYLELEVTESIVMTDVDRVITMLKQLKSTGIAIAIDDFGTGYSSLQYLQELPLDTLKIDRAFVRALDEKDPGNSVANSIVQLAKLFNLETVAEGVETDDQDMKIRSLGVHHIQGYLYSKPISARDLPDVIQRIGEQFKPQSDQDNQYAA